MSIQRVAHSSPLELGALPDSSFEQFLRKKFSDSKKVILVDENTHKHCLDYVLTRFSDLADAEIIILPSGEDNKVLEVCMQIWETLSEYQISRHDLIINLGGGVLTDMGGFIASVYKRGMEFVQLPTTLLSMIDASIGGKTGIDLGPFKNQIGTFTQPVALYIDPIFLETLPDEELKNGFAEMLKHGLISSRPYWNELKKSNFKDLAITLLLTSIKIKQRIVQSDPFERGERKKLNLGHTIGHGIEGLLMHSDKQIKHGHAVALGLSCESYISYRRNVLNTDDFNEISAGVSNLYEIPVFSLEQQESLCQIMLNDKKNSNGQIKAVLLEEIGSCIIDQVIEKSEIFDALNWLNEVKA